MTVPSRLMIEKLRGVEIYKELVLVRLKEDYKEISKGTKGTIVLIYDEKNCRIDFLINMEIP